MASIYEKDEPLLEIEDDEEKKQNVYCEISKIAFPAIL